MPPSNSILEVEQDPHREALYKAVTLFTGFTHHMLAHLPPKHHLEYKEYLNRVREDFELAHQCGDDTAARSCAADLATISRDILKLL